MKIDVDLHDGNGIFQMEDSQLDGPFKSVYDTEHEHTEITEWKLKGLGEVVHRSVHVTLKKGIGIEGMLGRFGG